MPVHPASEGAQREQAALAALFAHARGRVLGTDATCLVLCRHDDLESISDKALTDHAMIAKWAK